MPMDRKRYPANWDEIARQIKEDAGWRCEECGKPCRRPGMSWAEFVGWLLEQNLLHWYHQSTDEGINEESGERIMVEKPQRFTLTVAHLDHTPENCDRSNLKALCAPCHCRMDLKAMAHKKMLKLEREGQLQLF